MSQPAAKRTVMPPVPPPPPRLIGRAKRTVLPPAGSAEDIVSPDEVGAVLEPEGAEPDAQRGLHSGMFAKESSERVELQIEDLSLRLDNPYAASSLVPPASPSRAIPAGLVLGGTAVVVALGAALVWGAQRGAPVAVKATPLAPRTANATAVVNAPPPAPVSAAAITARPDADQPILTATAPHSQPGEVSRPSSAFPAPSTAPNAAASERVRVAVAPPSRAVAPGPVAEATDATRAEAAAADEAEEEEMASDDGEQGEVEAAIAAGSAGALPEVPTRAEVSAGFDAVRGALVECAAGRHGIVDIDATVAASGRISYALIGGGFKGSPEGSCMARAVRAARFPQFSRASLKVSYPISL